MNNKISVIIPAYNTADVISRTLKSVENQTYKNYEMIIINDGSTDGTKELLDNYKKDKTNIIVYHQENQGVSAARNKGLEICTGDYICFLDSDDTYESTFLEEMLRHLIKKESEAVYCGYNYINKKNKVKSYKRACKENDLLYYLNGGSFHFSAMLINKNALLREQIRFDCSKPLGEDILFTVMLLIKLKISCLNNRCLFNYTYRDNSVTKTVKTKSYFEKDIIAFNDIYDYITKYYNGQDKKKVLFFAATLKNERKINILIWLLMNFDFKSLKKEIEKINIQEMENSSFPLSKSRKKVLFYIKNNSLFKFILGHIYYRYIRRPVL